MINTDIFGAEKIGIFMGGMRKIAKTAIAAQAISMASREELPAAIYEMDGKNAATFLDDSRERLEQMVLQELSDYGWCFGLKFSAPILAKARKYYSSANDGFYPKDRTPRLSADDVALLATTHWVDNKEYGVVFDENEFAFCLINLTNKILHNSGFSTAWDAMMSLALENQDIEQKLGSYLSSICLLER